MKAKRYPKSYFAARRARIRVRNERKFAHAITRAYRLLARGAAKIVVNPIGPAPLDYEDVELRLRTQTVENLHLALEHVRSKVL